MKKGDVVIIAVVFLAALLPVLCLLFAGGETVVVRVDGEAVWSAPLGKDGETLVETAGGANRVAIKDGRVYILHADCPDRLCVKQGGISRPGQVIACLPNRLAVTIEGGGEYDAFTK